MGTLSYDRSPPIYSHFIHRLFLKTLIIMSISTNIHIPHVCDLLGSYILLICNSIHLITPYSSTSISYLYQRIK